MSADVADGAGRSDATTAAMIDFRERFSATLLPDGRVLVAGGYDVVTTFGALPTAEVFDPATGRWSSTGLLTAARWGHASALLRDGRVVVFGGRDENGLLVTSTVEAWDPGSGRWKPLAAEITSRMNLTATVLSDGKVLLVGGSDSTETVGFPTVELFDPATNTLATPGPASLGTARFGHTATRIGPGRVLVVGGSDGVPVTTREIWDQSTGLWTSGAGPTAPRYFHTATRLPDGKVLVSGGRSTGALQPPTATLEVWDPTTSGWSAAVSFAVARSHHSATLLADGMVFFAGGMDAADLPLGSTAIWSSPATVTADVATTARMRHAAVMLPDGRVLIVGGADATNTSLQSSDLWERGGATWSTTLPVAVGERRTTHAATLLPDGSVLVSGGWNNDGSNNPLSDSRRWLPSDSWVAAGAMNVARYIHTATLLPDGRVFAAGGFGGSGTLSSAEVWDSAGGWTPTNDSGQPRAAHTATLLGDGRVLVAGGCSLNAGAVCSDAGYLASVKIWNPTGEAWSDTNPLATAREYHTATLLADGRVMVVGGCNATGGGCTGSNNSLASVEAWDPALGTWSALPNLMRAREKHLAIALPDGRVLVAGGFDVSTLDLVEIWSPHTQTWTTVAPMTKPRRRHRGGLLPDGRILVAGGINATGELDDAEVYDPATNVWSAAGTFAGKRNNHTLTVLLDGQAFLFGGVDAGTRLASGAAWKPNTIVPQTLCIPEFGVAGGDLPADPWPSGATVRGFGRRLAGCSEGASGRTGMNATSNHPVVRFRSLTDGSLWDGRHTRSRDWKTDQLDFTVPGDAGFAPGYYAMQVVANGIASAPRAVRITRSHRKYYAHSEDGAGGADTHDLSETSPSSATGHTPAFRDPVFCQDTTPTALIVRLEKENACNSSTLGGSLVFPPAGFGQATAVSGSWTLRADVRRRGGGAAPIVRFFARLKRHSTGDLIFQTDRLTTVSTVNFPTNEWREITLSFVLPPRVTSTCPQADPEVGCASTTLPAGDRVRVEWWMEVVQQSATGSIELALESPGSTAASFATRIGSEFFVGPSPTSVHASALAARAKDGGVEVSWILDRTDDVVQMSVLSGDSPEGPWYPLQTGIAVALDAENGPYRAEDPDPGPDPWYVLDVELDDGSVERFGPVSPDRGEGAPGCACQLAPGTPAGPGWALLLVAMACVVLARRLSAGAAA